MVSQSFYWALELRHLRTVDVVNVSCEMRKVKHNSLAISIANLRTSRGGLLAKRERERVHVIVALPILLMRAREGKVSAAVQHATVLARSPVHPAARFVTVAAQCPPPAACGQILEARLSDKGCTLIQ